MENQDYLECITCGKSAVARKMYGNLCFECAQDEGIAQCENCGSVVEYPDGVPVLCDSCGLSISLD